VVVTIVDGEGDTLIDELVYVMGACALGSTSGENLIFLTGSGDPGLMVIDGDRDCPVRMLSSGYEFWAACVDPGIGKAFFLSECPPGLAVVDGYSGEYATFIPTGHEPFDLCCDSVNHFVYVAAGYPAAVTVVDVSGDTVVNTVLLDEWDSREAIVCVDSRDRKVYVGGTADYSLLVFNSACESLIASVWIGERVRALVYHEPGNRVYCGTDYGVVVVDCRTDTVIRDIYLGRAVSTLGLGSAHDRLYCVAGIDLLTIDCKSARIVGQAPFPKDRRALCYSSASDKVYCGGTGSASVHAGSDGHLLATLATGRVYGPWSFACDSRTKTVLCSSSESHAIAFIDGQSDQILTTLGVGVQPYGVATDGSLPLAFVCGRSDIAVVRKDTIPAEIGVAAVPGPTGSSLVRGRLYHNGDPGSVLMNAAGRKVLDLHPGPNDVSGLAPGVYFLREAQAQAQAVRKVVITR